MSAIHSALPETGVFGPASVRGLTDLLRRTEPRS